MVKSLLEIPDDLISNWDHTGINIIPGTAWSKGLQHEVLLALDDKWQITAVVCGSLTGNLLLFQLIYQGKLQPVYPKSHCPRTGISRALTIIGTTSKHLQFTLSKLQA